MPSPYVDKLAKETGKSVNEIESLWNKAKEITSDTFNIPEDSFTSKEYAYTVGIVQNMLGLKEKQSSFDLKTFLEKDMSAKDFIKSLRCSMTSSSFSALDKNDLTGGKKDSDDDDDDEDDDDDDDEDDDDDDENSPIGEVDEDGLLKPPKQ